MNVGRASQAVTGRYMATEERIGGDRQEMPKSCPVCNGEIERGSVSVHGTLLGFLFVGMSYQNCWFKGQGKKEQVVVFSGQQTRGFRCATCGFVGIFKAESQFIPSGW